MSSSWGSPPAGGPGSPNNPAGGNQPDQPSGFAGSGWGSPAQAPGQPAPNPQQPPPAPSWVASGTQTSGDQVAGQAPWGASNKGWGNAGSAPGGWSNQPGPQPGWAAPAQPAWGEQQAEIPVPEEKPMEFFTPFQLAFQGPDAMNNLLIGSVMLMIPVLGQILIQGWCCEIMKRLIRKQENVVPKLDFSDFSYWLQRGIIVFGAQWVIQVPLQMFGYIVSVGLQIMVFAIAGVGAAAGGKAAGVSVAIAYAVLLGFVLALVPVLGLLVHAILMRAEISEDFGQTFKVGSIFDMLGKTWLTVIGSSFVMGMISMVIALGGMLALCFGLLPAALIISVATTHFRYQVYMKYLARGGEQIPMKQAPPIPSELGRGGYA